MPRWQCPLQMALTFFSWPVSFIESLRRSQHYSPMHFSVDMNAFFDKEIHQTQPLLQLVVLVFPHYSQIAFPVTATSHALNVWWPWELEFSFTPNTARNQKGANVFTILLTNKDDGLLTRHSVSIILLANGRMLTNNLGMMLSQLIKVNNSTTIE